MRDHLPEYLSELFGTAIMMMVGIGAILLMWGDGSPVQVFGIPVWLRRLLTGILVAGGGTLGNRGPEKSAPCAAHQGQVRLRR